MSYFRWVGTRYAYHEGLNTSRVDHVDIRYRNRGKYNLSIISLSGSVFFFRNKFTLRTLFLFVSPRPCRAVPLYSVTVVPYTPTSPCTVGSFLYLFLILTTTFLSSHPSYKVGLFTGLTSCTSKTDQGRDSGLSPYCMGSGQVPSILTRPRPVLVRGSENGGVGRTT